MLHQISDFFDSADTTALALLLAFLVPFAATLLRPFDFGYRRSIIVGNLERLQKQAVLGVARTMHGSSIVTVINEITKESPIIINPIGSVVNKQMLTFSIIAIVSGVLTIFHDPLLSDPQIEKGLFWTTFIVSLIIACLYFYGEYKVWVEYRRLKEKYGTAPSNEDIVKVVVDQT